MCGNLFLCSSIQYFYFRSLNFLYKVSFIRKVYVFFLACRILFRLGLFSKSRF